MGNANIKYRKQEFEKISEQYIEYKTKVKFIKPNGETNWLYITNDELQSIINILIGGWIIMTQTHEKLVEQSVKDGETIASLLQVIRNVVPSLRIGQIIFNAVYSSLNRTVYSYNDRITNVFYATDADLIRALSEYINKHKY